jgi:hypothetical protein
MPNTQDTDKQESNKPNPVTQELLEKLGKPTQPTGCAADSTGGVTVGCGRAGDVFNQHSEGVAGVGSASQTNVVNQQLTAPAEATAQPGGGGSVVVDCRYCGGCCGGLQGRRLPKKVVELIQLIEEKLGLRYECEVINKYPELFCRRIGRRGHGLGRVKELERLLSREGEYKASYVLGRLRECLNDAVCWRYLRLGVEGWFRVVHLLANREPGDVEAYFAGLVRGLGFGSVVELSKYMRLIDQGLVDFNYVNRGRGFRDVLSVRCRICGGVIDVTGPLPSVLARLIRHFRVEHGLKAVSDVEAKVKELEGRGAERPEGDDIGVKLLRNSAGVTQLVRLVVHRLVDRGLLERIGKEYRCRACNADVGGAVEALVHVMDHHYDVVNSLLSGRTTPSAGGVNGVVDELANLFSSGNPDAVRPVVKALVRGILDVLNTRGSISTLMLTRVLNENEDYKPLIDSLTTGNMKADRVVAMIVETMARHGIVHVDGEVVKVE